MLRSYRQLKTLLRMEDHPVLGIFEQYCKSMDVHTRVLEWSCKLTPEGLEPARFLHTAGANAVAPSVSAIRSLYRSLRDRGRVPEQEMLFDRLPSLLAEVGQGVA